MGRHPYLREIAVLPCLPAGMSVEDSYLRKSGPCFGLQWVGADDALARTLSFLNISKGHYVQLVKQHTGIDVLADRDQNMDRGAWCWRGSRSAEWRALRVRHNYRLPPLLGDDDLVTIMDNASYGRQLAITGYVDRDFHLPDEISAVTLTGRFQLGVIDYIWGSGHTVTFDGSLTVDLTDGQIGDAPGYAYDGVCDFVVDYFRFDSIARADLPPGRRFIAERRSPSARAA